MWGNGRRKKTYSFPAGGVRGKEEEEDEEEEDWQIFAPPPLPFPPLISDRSVPF